MDQGQQEGRKTVWAIGGGKGGSGKSFVSANIGICLSKMGFRVVLIDADLGGANLHTFLGLRPPACSLSDFLRKRVTDLQEILLPTSVPNLQLLVGAQDFLNSADSNSFKRQKLFRSIRRLESDFTIVDLGAGTSLSILDFFLMSDGRILIVTPEPTSLENAYRFLKSALYRSLRTVSDIPEVKKVIDEAMDPKNEMGIQTPYDLIDAVRRVDLETAIRLEKEVEVFQPNLIINQVRSREDIEMGFSIRSVCQKYFGLQLRYLGYISHDQDVGQSIRKRSPLVLDNPQSKAARCISEIAARLSGSRETTLPS
jgi:flagellar biosynthesis protein FlhG